MSRIFLFAGLVFCWLTFAALILAFFIPSQLLIVPPIATGVCVLGFLTVDVINEWVRK